MQEIIFLELEYKFYLLLMYNFFMYCSHCGGKIGKVTYCPLCGKSQKNKKKLIIDNKIGKILKKYLTKIRLPGFFKKIKLNYFFYLVLVVFFFSIIIFFILPNSDLNSNILLVYPQIFFQLIKSGNLFSVIGLTFLMLIPFALFIIRKIKKDKLFNIKTLFRLVLTNFIIIIISFYLALLVTGVFGLITTISFSKKLNESPETLNVILDIDSIKNKLNSEKIIPKIIEANRENLSKIIASRHQNKSYSDFYRKNLLSIISDFNPVKVKPINQGLIMVDNDLIVFELKRDELEKIAPNLGYLLIEKYFSPRYIKSFPELRVLGRQDYIKIRDEQINKRLNVYEYIIEMVELEIDQNIANISEAKSKISYNEKGLSDSKATKESSYTNCTLQGYFDYFSGKFFRYYSDETCRNRSNSWDEIISKFEKNISDWKSSLYYDQSQLNENKKLLSYFSDWKEITESEKNSTPLELGVFYEDNKIDVAFDWTNNKSIISFLETLSHEYLHYASYISDEKSFENIAFEEGLTEYYARSIIKDFYNRDTNIGYPLLMKVMSQIFTKLPKEHLEKVYFEKDEESLISLLNSTFGKDFYEKNELSFIFLPYLSGKEAVDTANKIIKSIDGQEVSEKDLEGEIK